MRFTLITEGVSENRIIKNILFKYFKGTELYFRDAQPQIINQKQATTGGWNEVLKYCERTDDLTEIFNNTDYLIIQIDSDQSQIKPFNISHTSTTNNAKSFDELYLDITAKLESLIDPSILDKYKNRIIFAICIHTIECWLLPLYYSNNHKSNTRNCIGTLNYALRKKNIHNIAIRDKNNPNSIKTYDIILNTLKRKQDVIDVSQSNVGFSNFINSLENIEKTNY